MTEADIIRQAYKRDGIKGDKAISRETGINYDRLHKRRLAPGWFENMTIGELRTLMRRAYFTDQEIIQITKGETNDKENTTHNSIDAYLHHSSIR